MEILQKIRGRMSLSFIRVVTEFLKQGANPSRGICMIDLARLYWPISGQYVATTQILDKTSLPILTDSRTFEATAVPLSFLKIVLSGDFWH